MLRSADIHTKNTTLQILSHTHHNKQPNDTTYHKYSTRSSTDFGWDGRSIGPVCDGVQHNNLRTTKATRDQQGLLCFERDLQHRHDKTKSSLPCRKDSRRAGSINCTHFLPNNLFVIEDLLYLALIVPSLSAQFIYL